jgi:O-antigen ligase
MTRAQPPSAAIRGSHDDAWFNSAVDAWRQAQQDDRIGHHVHTALAMAYLATLPLATAPNSVAFGLLAAYTILRLRYTWPLTRTLAHSPAGWFMLAWTAWYGLSILWSSDVSQGLTELGAFRVIALTFMLLPVLDRVVWLIWAFLGGVLVQNGIQLAEQMAWFGLTTEAGRAGGLVHVNITALMCAAAMCWHLSGALWSGWRMALLHVLGLAASGFGLLATGSRALWLATAVALPLALIIIPLRQPRTGRRAMVITLLLIGAGIIAWPAVSEFVSSRSQRIVHEITLAQAGDYASDIGHRLASWGVAWRHFTDEPILGTGAGAFRVPRSDEAYGRLLGEYTHAHSSYLQILACTGVVGGVLALGAIALLVRQTWRDRADHAFAAAMPLIAFVWLIGGIFDTYQERGTTFGVLLLLAALTLPQRPPLRSARAGGSP